MGVYGWYDLSWKERRTVLRLARRGERHPDPRIARVAEEWARETLEPGAFLSGLFALFGDDGFGQRRGAKRILRVSAGRRPGTR
ncbi:hypothetical protein DQ244_02010 [Blastococcus sp. TBT05-19]|uniref:hypothetical protein n=1 Tax=Blastococcus sp. TBT05-19 TaxID=2250581 RepID=UPI000DE828A8|nr:hypothetical protein [Blastococcus sp. TBT05-19]RBY94156.1 hypothetical protein DQ244_02010 [Blastococcus sp. TBT05-19]